jgi:hypothetical protein
MPMTIARQMQKKSQVIQLLSTLKQVLSTCYIPSIRGTGLLLRSSRINYTKCAIMQGSIHTQKSLFHQGRDQSVKWEGYWTVQLSKHFNQMSFQKPKGALWS